jgi:hypothetical protein
MRPANHKAGIRLGASNSGVTAYSKDEGKKQIHLADCRQQQGIDFVGSR